MPGSLAFLVGVRPTPCVWVWATWLTAGASCGILSVKVAGCPSPMGPEGKLWVGHILGVEDVSFFHLAARSVPILRVLFSGARQRPFLDP